MKKLLFVLSVLAILILVYFLTTKSQQIPSTDNNSSLPLVQPTTYSTTLPDNLQKIEITFAQQQLVIYLTAIEKLSKMSLVANFTGKESGLALVEKNHCLKAINGGFYTEDDKPLGLFVSEGKESGKTISSNLATGFFFQDKTGQKFISKIKPENLQNLDFILQTGPLLAIGDYQLRLVSDEKTRRMLLGMDKKGGLYLLSVTDQNNSFDGPLLSDLPRIFNLKEVQQRLALSTLLNLDGGGASLFYVSDNSNNFSLSEITPIGSLFCIK